MIVHLMSEPLFSKRERKRLTEVALSPPSNQRDEMMRQEIEKLEEAVSALRALLSAEREGGRDTSQRQSG